MMSWSSRKKKEGIFLYRLFCPIEIFFNTCILAQCILYRIHFQNIHTFTYQKTLLQTLLLFVFKIVESLQCIVNSLLNELEIYWVTSNVWAVTSSNSEKSRQINLLQGKAKNLLKTGTLIYALFIKVSQNDHFWVAPSFVLL